MLEFKCEYCHLVYAFDESEVIPDKAPFCRFCVIGSYSSGKLVKYVRSDPK